MPAAATPTARASSAAERTASAPTEASAANIAVTSEATSGAAGSGPMHEQFREPCGHAAARARGPTARRASTTDRRAAGPRRRRPRARRPPAGQQELSQRPHASGPASATTVAVRRRRHAGDHRHRPEADAHAAVGDRDVDVALRPAGQRVARGGLRIGALQDRGGARLGGVARELARRPRGQQLPDRERDQDRQREDADELDARLAARAAATAP